MFQIRYTDPAGVQLYGCGVNPAGSLTPVDPGAHIGESFDVAFDNPLGTQSPGSLTILGLSAAPDAGHPCGTLLPGFGMAGLLADGELLLDLTPGVFLGPVPGPVWQGTPIVQALEIPYLTSLIGDTAYLQGAIVDPTFGGGTGAGIALTEALEVRIGS